jgi:hypothetical protein
VPAQFEGGRAAWFLGGHKDWHGAHSSFNLSDIRSAYWLVFLQLALKHRKNKNGGQRIIAFVGSPVDADEKELKRLGAALKKSNVRPLCGRIGCRPCVVCGYRLRWTSFPSAKTTRMRPS